MAAFTRGLRVSIPLVLDSNAESAGGIVTPSLCRHATTFATRRLRKDWGFLAGGFAAEGPFAALLEGRTTVAAPKPHLFSTVLLLRVYPSIVGKYEGLQFH